MPGTINNLDDILTSGNQPNWRLNEEWVEGSDTPGQDASLAFGSTIVNNVDGVANRPDAQLWAYLKRFISTFRAEHDALGAHDWTSLLATLTNLTNANIDANAGIEESKLDLCLTDVTSEITGDPYETTCDLADDINSLYTELQVLEMGAAATQARPERILKAFSFSGWLPPHGNGNNSDVDGVQRLGVGYVSTEPSGIEDSSDGTITEVDTDGTLYVPTIGGSFSTESINRFSLRGKGKIDLHVHGFLVALEGRPSRQNRLIFQLGVEGAGAGVTRQDMVALEFWKEKVDFTAGKVAVVFPYGNIHFDSNGAAGYETTYDNCTLYIGNGDDTDNQVGTGNTNYPLYVDHLTGNQFGDNINGRHGKYIKSTDSNFKSFVANPLNNMVANADGTMFQFRWRIRVFENWDPIFTGKVTIDSGSVTPAYKRPQGQTLSDVGGISKTDAAGIFLKQDGQTIAQATKFDPGIFLGGQYVNDITPLQPITGNSIDGFTYLIPIVLIHRRNNGSFDLTNINGGTSFPTTPSDRPDELFCNILARRDVYDLRQRIYTDGIDYQELIDESLNLLYKGDLQTVWKDFQFTTDGCAITSTNIFGTKHLNIEAVKGTIADYADLGFGPIQLINDEKTDNGRNSDFDGLRNYYSDVPGEQVIIGRVPDESVDGAFPSVPFSYNSTPDGAEQKVLSFDLHDSLAAHDGTGADAIYNPRYVGYEPAAYWTNGRKARMSWAGNLPNDISLTGSLHKRTMVYIEGTDDILVDDVTTYLTTGSNLIVDLPVVINGTITGLLKQAYVVNEDESIGVSSTTNAKGVVVLIGAGFTPPTSITSLTIDSNVITLPSSLNYLIGFELQTDPSELDFFRQTVYSGEGWEMHSGEEFFAYMTIRFSEGSGWLERPITTQGDSNSWVNSISGMLKSQFFVRIGASATQQLPNDGLDWIPFGSSLDFNNKGAFPDPHTKSFGFAGFVNKNQALPGDGTDVDTYTISSLPYNSFHDPWVIKNSNTDYEMYITLRRTNMSSEYKIARFTSIDGVRWTGGQIVLIPAEPLFGGGCLAPCVIKKSSVIYEMYFTGLNSSLQSRIFRTTSADGITWATPTIFIPYDTIEGEYPLNATVIWSALGGGYEIWFVLYNDQSKLKHLLKVNTNDAEAFAPTDPFDIAEYEHCFLSLWNTQADKGNATGLFNDSLYTAPNWGYKDYFMRPSIVKENGTEGVFYRMWLGALMSRTPYSIGSGFSDLAGAIEVTSTIPAIPFNVGFSL